MFKNMVVVALSLFCILFGLYGCIHSELEHFLKISPEKMESHRALTEKILKDEVCSKLQDEQEKTKCTNLKVKTSMTTFGFAFVKRNDQGTIYIEPISIIFSKSFLATMMAHEVGHIILNKKKYSDKEIIEIQADLYAAKIVGKNNVILFLEQMPQIFTTPEHAQSMLDANEYRIIILALSGW